jgi:hypothetical protein
MLKTHADGNQFIPSRQCFGLEEVGGVVRRECLVDLKGCDFGRNFVGSVDFFIRGEMCIEDVL